MQLSPQCEQAIEYAMSTIGGSREYFSLAGYGVFESKLFNKSNWLVLAQKFPEIAPYLENLRHRVHAEIRLGFQPQIAEAVEGYLAKAGYPEWSPNFLKRHNDAQARRVHTWVANHVQGLNGRPDWQMMVGRLSDQAKEKFSIEPAGRKIPEHGLFPLFLETLDRIIKTYGYWTPALVEHQWKRLYLRLIQRFRKSSSRSPSGKDDGDADRPNWQEILTQLPEKYRSKFWWVFGRETSYRRESDAVGEVTGLLKQFKPQRWGPRWLDHNGGSAVRQYWENHFRNPDSTIDWTKLLQQLPIEWQKKFGAGS